MRTVADEHYLKEIYTLELDHSHVTTSMLAFTFGCSPASVTGMLKKLANLLWVVYEPYQGVKLTSAGREIALEVIRHHRLIETYLSRELDIPRDRLHAEADKLEHALSEYLEDRIDSLLGHPLFDPHGSPIPSRAGNLPGLDHLRLSDLAEGSVAEVLEIEGKNTKRQTYLNKLGLQPVNRLRVVHVDSNGGEIAIQVAGKTCVLKQKTASHVVVRMVS